MLFKIYFPSILKEYHDFLSVLWIQIWLDLVPVMAPDMVPVKDLFPSNRALQNSAVHNTNLTKVALANSK
jgi:hypothetical protein